MTTITELVPEHFAQISSWLSRSEIRRWLTAEWREVLATSSRVAIMVRNKRNRVFMVKSNERPCGVVALAEIDTADKTAMVWYLNGEEILGRRGIITDAVKQIAVLAFSQMGLESLYAWTMDDNAPSKKVLQKVGFRQVGRIRRATSSAGRQVDRVYFDLIASDMSSAFQTLGAGELSSDSV